LDKDDDPAVHEKAALKIKIFLK